jgi:hypothetical protein
LVQRVNKGRGTTAPTDGDNDRRVHNISIVVRERPSLKVLQRATFCSGRGPCADMMGTVCGMTVGCSTYMTGDNCPLTANNLTDSDRDTVGDVCGTIWGLHLHSTNDSLAFVHFCVQPQAVEALQLCACTLYDRQITACGYLISSRRTTTMTASVRCCLTFTSPQASICFRCYSSSQGPCQRASRVPVHISAFPHVCMCERDVVMWLCLYEHLAYDCSDVAMPV